MLLFIRSLKQIWRRAKSLHSLANMGKFFLGLFCVIALAAFGIANASEKKREIGIFELKRGDLSVKFTNWGATIVSVLVPDKHGLSPFWSPFFVGVFKVSVLVFLNSFPFFSYGFLFSGKLDDVVLGYDSIREYQVRF